VTEIVAIEERGEGLFSVKRKKMKRGSKIKVINEMKSFINPVKKSSERKASPYMEIIFHARGN